jgi:cellulose synthase operon protein C
MSSVISRELDELTQLQMSVLSDYERALLMACAPLNQFTPQLLSGVPPQLLSGVPPQLLSGVQPDPKEAIEQLVRHSFIQRVSHQPRVYRVSDYMRRALLESWWQEAPGREVPPKLAELSRHFAETLRAAGTDDVDVIGVALFAGRDSALEEWEILFTEAEQRFDLLRCRSLLDLLSWASIMTADFEAVREQYQTYLDTRSLWTDEWYRTIAFVLPHASEGAFEELLTGSGKVLELRGYAGYGKTTHLCWLIARRCVPARIPCARIDFDAVDPLTATRYPHLVLLEMADQLDRQLPGDAFGKLVRTYAAEHARLFGREAPRSATAPDVRKAVSSEDRSPIGEDVKRRFTARLAEMSDEQRVVLILDTLEVPLHLADSPSGPAIKALFEVLAEIHRQAPCVRIVLASRYHIDATLRGLFSETCEPFELPRFTSAEAQRYLIEKRHVRESGQVDAAMQASACIPFSLALLADLIDQDPTIEPKVIAAYRGAEFAYLVERVVKRIGETPVRWVLRYAAIPRRFDYEFVHDVLWDRVREAMSGNRTLDNPATDGLPGTEAERASLWPTGSLASTESAVRSVWEQVKRYANGSSWIRPDERDPDTLRLQSEVVNPLRELLRDKGITPSIHAAATNYFLDRAATERTSEGPRPDIVASRSLSYMREAVFHRFQLEGEAADSWWHDQISAAPYAEIRFALADELARQPEYSDQHNRPIPRGEKDLVSDNTLQAARLELCLASAELATTDPLDDIHPTNDPRVLWQTAIDAWNRLTSRSTDTLATGRLALARAAMALGAFGGEFDADVQAALTEPGPTPRELLWIAVLQVEALVRIRAGSVVGERLSVAQQVAAKSTEDRDLRRRLVRVACRYNVTRGAYSDAIAECERARHAKLADAEFHIIEAQIRLACGDAETARALAAEVDANHPLSLWAVLIEAQSWRMQRRLAMASACAAHALARAQTASPSSTLGVRESGLALLEVAAAATPVLDVETARTALSEGARVFELQDQQDDVVRCHLDAARLHMRWLGHLRAAGVALDHATRAAPPGGSVAFRAQLLRAELARLLEDATSVRTALNRAELLYDKTSPTDAVALAIYGIRFGHRRDRERYGDLLAKNLGQLDPPTARLRLLDRIELGPTLKASSSVAKQLREKVVPAEGWDDHLRPLAARDRARLRLRAAAFARLITDESAAKELLEAAVTELQEGGCSAVELREAMLLARSLQPRPTKVLTELGTATLDAALRAADQYPLLTAAVIIEHLEDGVDISTHSGSEAQTLSTKASMLLAEGGANVEAWIGRLAERQAVINPVTPQPFLHAAMQSYAAAGDRRRYDQVRRNVTGGDETKPQKNRIAVDVSLTSNNIVAKVEGKRSRGWWSGRTPITRKLTNAIVEWANSFTPEPYPPDIPDLMLGDWLGFEGALAELSAAAEILKRQRRTGNAGELSVRVRDGSLQALPWELALDTKRGKPLADSFARMYRSRVQPAPSTRLIRFVQSGLNMLVGSSLEVDGVSGPDTEQALARWQEDNQLDRSADNPDLVQRLHQAILQGARPIVLVVRAVAAPGSRRSYVIERRYARAGIEATTVSAVYADLPTVLASEPPPVALHINAGIVATSGGVAIDLQERTWGWLAGKEARLLTPPDVDRTLRLGPVDWPPPIVVLDVPRPTGQREAVDQLLLRNYFAAELYALGGARAVVATGLGDSRSTEIVQDVLVEGLARGDTIGDIVAQIRTQRPRDGFTRVGSSLPFSAIALWTDDASMRLPASPRG